MIHMNNKINYLLGEKTFNLKVLPIYSDVVCDFLNDLSKMLRRENEAKEYSDILTFAFWCRKANIVNLKEKYTTTDMRVGKGMVFHIAPSNVPINFAYSLAFGMLAGNGNIVRVSQKDFPQVHIVCNAMDKLFKKSEYKILKDQTQVISYEHNNEINEFFSIKCNMRVIWGGDETIEMIRKSPIRPRSGDITFSDRFSFAIFDEEYLEGLSEIELKRVAEKFYNDTYLMDQNACSSPHLILWKKSRKHNKDDNRGRNDFWRMLKKVIQNYDFEEKKAMDKLTLLYKNIVKFPEIEKVNKYTNLLYVVELNNIPPNVEELRGIFGLFYESEIEKIEEICKCISEKTQTCVISGIDKENILRMFIDNHIRGIDRIVDIGKAMDINVDWDGYDIIGSLSRGMHIS